jgi:hypothetical protein
MQRARDEAARELLGACAVYPVSLLVTLLTVTTEARRDR